MLTLNPGFAPILAALVIFAIPLGLRPWLMASVGFAGFFLLLGREFGAAEAIAQMGLPVVFLSVDALNRVFGVSSLILLIAIAIHSNSRRSASEDAAILLLSGSVLSALFAGDLISFVAATSLAGLAASWVVLASNTDGAGRAGGLLLIWNGIEGLLLLLGVAMRLRLGTEGLALARMDASNVGDSFILAALLIRVAAPLVHVWFKNAVSHATPTGAAALSAFTTVLGVYGLARLFPAEPILTPIGAAMVMLGAVYATADGDLRRRAAYAQIMCFGVCVSLIGLGSPIAMAAAVGHAFTLSLAFAGIHFGLGNGQGRSAFAVAFFGMAVSAAPGFGPFITQSVALEAAAQWELRGLWVLIVATPAVTLVCLVLRPIFAASGLSMRPSFAAMLAQVVLGFFCVAVGLAPQWLYGLLPTELAFEAYTWRHAALQFQVLGAAGLAATWLLGAAPQLTTRPYDVDAIYGGPFAVAGRWFAAIVLSGYDAVKRGLGGGAKLIGSGVEAILQRCDRPYEAANLRWAHPLWAAALIAIFLYSAM
jgi:multicomponent Na+:H+ antiporter subunit D